MYGNTLSSYQHNRNKYISNVSNVCEFINLYHALGTAFSLKLVVNILKKNVIQFNFCFHFTLTIVEKDILCYDQVINY